MGEPMTHRAEPADPGGLRWHDEALLGGLRVRAYFVDPHHASADVDARHALATLFGDAAPRLLAPAREGGGYRVGDLHAEPDAVFEHGNGVICLWLAAGERLLPPREQWAQQLRLATVVQALIAAMAVAGQTQRPTVALLRTADALYQVDPSPAALECLASHIGAAQRDAGLAGPIGPLQLAAFCVPRLCALPQPLAAGAPAGQCDSGFSDTVPSATTVAGH